MNRREATNLIRSRGAVVVGVDAKKLDWVVIGADEPPLAEAQLLSDQVLAQAARGELEILHETDLWERLGLVDVEQSIRSYHTPAMLASLLGVSVRVIRRWHRLGLISPIRTVHKLPYFDYQEVATAKRLAGWIAKGASGKAIEQKLVDLVEVVPHIRRPLDQLSILIEGKHVLLRDGGGLLEPSGQMRFDFDAIEDQLIEELESESDPDEPISISIANDKPGPADDLLAAAYASEDEGDLDTAIDFYHAILSRDGARADISFQIAELLYRSGEIIAARERYYTAIELDPEFVEARTSLGNVLAETGQLTLAIAAFRGAISLHEEYAEAHFDLARVLEQTGLPDRAMVHWKRFVELSPESMWADEARDKIQQANAFEQ